MKKHFSRQGNRGFTLLEVIIALSVFLLLAASVFGIFTATLESVSGLQDNQNHGDEVEALGAFLKKSFLELPADGILISFHRDGAPFQVSGVIWGDDDSLRAIDMLPQANGYYTLRMSTYTRPPLAPASPAADFQREIVTNDPSLSWRALVRNVRSADWKFRDPKVQVWTDHADAKPLLAELTLQLAGAASSATDDFWIPPLMPPGNPVISAVANPGNAP